MGRWATTFESARGTLPPSPCARCNSPAPYGHFVCTPPTTARDRATPAWSPAEAASRPIVKARPHRPTPQLTCRPRPLQPLVRGVYLPLLPALPLPWPPAGVHPLPAPRRPRHLTPIVPLPPGPPLLCLLLSPGCSLRDPRLNSGGTGYSSGRRLSSRRLRRLRRLLPVRLLRLPLLLLPLRTLLLRLLLLLVVVPAPRLLRVPAPRRLLRGLPQPLQVLQLAV